MNTNHAPKEREPFPLPDSPERQTGQASGVARLKASPSFDRLALLRSARPPSIGSPSFDQLALLRSGRVRLKKRTLRTCPQSPVPVVARLKPSRSGATAS